nr:epidermal growth factor receptor substrate 15 homolog [Ipomoea batatas]
MRGFYDSCISSPRTPEYDHREAANSLDFSSEDNATPVSPDDMFLKDLNPCLTPYDKTKSKEFYTFDVPDDQDLHSTISFSSCARKLSKSSDCCQCSKSGNK